MEGEMSAMTKVLVPLLFLVLPLVVVGCVPTSTTPEATAVPRATEASNPTEVSNPRMITVGELHTMLQNKDFTLINVHIPYEGEIPGTNTHIPYNEIDRYTDELPQDKSAKIVLYCRSGSMSATASQTLVEMGYTNVIDVQGGMKAWQAAGYELLKSSQAPAVTPPTATRSASVAAAPATNTPSATPATTYTASDVQRITPADAKALLDNGAAVLYDTRSAEAYHTQHAAGALSFPETTMIARYQELPGDKALIFYCT